MHYECGQTAAKRTDVKAKQDPPVMYTKKTAREQNERNVEIEELEHKKLAAQLLLVLYPCR